MTDKEFLHTQSRLIRERLRRDSVTLEQKLERTLGPLMRRHPRKSLAAGAAAGLLVGRIIAPSPGKPTTPARRGPLRGALAFVRDTGVFALRSTLVGAVLPRSRGAGPAEPSEG